MKNWLSQNWFELSLFFLILGAIVFHHYDWTALAVIVALAAPWAVEYVQRNRKSCLVFKGIKITNHEEYTDEPSLPTGPLSVGRLIVKNEGKYTARNVEAHLDGVVFDGDTRKNFIPMPLLWTHGKLLSHPTVRDIRPSQTVYLDILNHFYDNEYVGDHDARFAVATGLQYDELSRLNIGTSLLHIKLYQDSGQVSEVIIDARWNDGEVPKLAFSKHLFSNQR